LSYGTHAFESFSVTLDSIDFEDFKANDISIQFVWIDKRHIDLTISSEQISSILPGQIIQLQIRCQDAVYEINTVTCDHGNLIIQHDSLGQIDGDFQFAYQLQQGLVSMSMKTTLLSGGDMDLNFTRNIQGWKGILNMNEIVTSQIQGLFAHYGLFQDHALTSGTINGSIMVTGKDNYIDVFKAKAEASNLAIDGENILEGVTLTSNMTGHRKGSGWQITHDAVIHQGAMYLIPGIEILGDKPGFYLEVEDKPVTLKAEINWISEDRIELSDLIIEHPDHLQLHANANINTPGNLSLDKFDFAVTVQDLTRAFPVYIQPLLLQTNFSDMEISGAVELQIDFTEDKLDRFFLNIDDLYVDDTHDRYSLSGVTASISLEEQISPISSNLQWEGMSVYRIDLGPGDIKFESSGKNIRIVDWQDVEILDGTLLINSLSLKNVGTTDFELLLDGILTPISMQAFTQAIGWPLFPGKLSSVITGLRYSHNSVEIDSDILIRVFNGDVILRGLFIEDLFSGYSTLTTDIEVNRLDLEQLTDTFAFGKIEGSLSGRMARLKLEDWQPAYFEAVFASPEDDDRPHRISQKALENLNQIGGGLSGTLSNGFLRVFPSYSYGRIGFSCRLANGICELGGVEETANGFFLLTRGGVLPPWVDVRGTGRSIKWEELVGGLNRIAEGEISLE
jgi:hypothetical protein